MTMHDTTQGDILAAARLLQEEKLTAIQRLVDTRTRIATIRTQLADAEREDGNAYAAAVKAGWSESELRQVGVTPPAKQAARRPRSARSRDRSRNASDDPAPNGRALLGLPPRGEAHVDGERQPEPAGAGA